MERNYITYNTEILCNWLGAQYQRIVGVIALANKYDFQYVHTPIQNMEFVNTIEHLNEIENYFQIKNNYPNVNEFTYDQIIAIDNPSEDQLLHLSIVHDKKVLIKMCLPYSILDKYPIYYNYGMEKLKSIKQKIDVYDLSDTQNIAIHIRQGDVSPTENNK